jgi:hypothetical protein
MAAQDPTTNFLWDQPDVGSDTGAWGGILNAVIGRWLDDGAGGIAIPGSSAVTTLDTSLSDDFDSAPVEPEAGSELALYLGDHDSLKDAAADTATGSGVPPGIDQTVWLLSKALDVAEWRVLDITNRVTTLEASNPALLAGRLSPSSAQSVPRSSGGTPVVWGTVDLSVGSVAQDTNQLTVPADGQGLWQLYATISMKYQAKQDDGRFIRVIIVKGSTILSDCRHPYTTNGAHTSNSGNVTVEASVITAVTEAEVGEVFQVWVEHGDIGTAEVVVNEVGSFFFATRITKELP